MKAARFSVHCYECGSFVMGCESASIRALLKELRGILYCTSPDEVLIIDAVYGTIGVVVSDSGRAIAYSDVLCSFRAAEVYKV